MNKLEYMTKAYVRMQAPTRHTQIQAQTRTKCTCTVQSKSKRVNEPPSTLEYVRRLGYMLNLRKTQTLNSKDFKP